MDACSRSIVGCSMHATMHARVEIAALRMAIFEWIEVWHQRKRIHGSVGYVSPEAFEAASRAG
jgi:putative transposase